MQELVIKRNAETNKNLLQRFYHNSRNEEYISENITPLHNPFIENKDLQVRGVDIPTGGNQPNLNASQSSK